VIRPGDVVVNIERVCVELEQLAQFSDSPAPSVTRILFTQPDLEARIFVCERMSQAGLQVHTDAAGNIFGRWDAGDPLLPPVATGSHIDAIPHAGRFDGTVGVLGGLEALRTLRESGFQPKRPLELIVFNSEEPTRYGIGCLGSRLLSGQLDTLRASQLVDTNQVTFEETRRMAGCHGSLADVVLSPGQYHAFVELHIEQGPKLEEASIPIGVVTAIAAPAAVRVVFHGKGGHAGTVLMPERVDALLPAAQLALVVEQLALHEGGHDTVATTGLLQVHPGAINSIPSRVTMEIDVRDIELDRRNRVLDRIQQQAQEIGNDRNLKTTVELINADPPATCNPTVVAAVKDTCRTIDVTCLEMISRAYHDALFMALIAPTTMVFIPCRDGISHRPEEFATPEAIKTGIHVLAGTLKRLAE